MKKFLNTNMFNIGVRSWLLKIFDSNGRGEIIKEPTSWGPMGGKIDEKMGCTFCFSC